MPRRDKHPLPRDWRQRRLAVFERDGWECQVCGKLGQALECDHVTPRERGGDDSLENLRTICRACHIDLTTVQNGGPPKLQAQKDWEAFANRRGRAWR